MMLDILFYMKSLNVVDNSTFSFKTKTYLKNRFSEVSLAIFSFNLRYILVSLSFSIKIKIIMLSAIQREWASTRS